MRSPPTCGHEARRPDQGQDGRAGYARRRAADGGDRYAGCLLPFAGHDDNPHNQAFCRHAREELIWPTRDGLVIHSIFMHPVAISARLMSRPLPSPVRKCRLRAAARVLQHDGRVTVLQKAELAAAQFGAPAGREEFLDGGFSLEAFIEAHEADYAAHRRCFASRQFFPSGNVPYPPSADCD